MANEVSKKWALRIGKSVAILVGIWVVAYWFVGANAAFGVVLAALVLGVIGALLT
jgi:hypothetical protein